jgi:hypothetical protein
VDGLDRINAAVAARKNKREGKTPGGKASAAGAPAPTAAELAAVAEAAAAAADAALAAVTVGGCTG